MSDYLYRINRPEVIDENFEDEYVIVNLNTGVYYTLNETGGLIWDMLAQNMSRAAILETLQNTFDANPESIVANAETLLDTLEREQLIVRSGDTPQSSIPHSVPGERRAYSAPELEKFTDMEALLLLDPIHQVDDSGWPSAKPKAR